MIKTTKAQRLALKAVYDRGPLVFDPETETLRAPIMEEGYYLVIHPLTYKQFRAHVKPFFECIMIPWQGMWLGIEPDGHIHS